MKREEERKKPKAVIFTLGCKVNEVESASLAEGLALRGYEVSVALGYADLYILNTCAVTAEAEKKSRQLIARARKYNPAAAVVVCGCAAQKDPQAFASREGVLVVTGAQAKSRLFDLLDKKGVFLEEDGKKFDELPFPAAVKTRNFVKIQDGCNRFCSYCVIPYLRGRSRSRPMESVVAEVRSSRAEETVITGVDISSYDDNGRKLPELLLALKDIPTRLRLGSLEPRAVSEDLLSAAKKVHDFAPHFHLSLQSGSDRILSKMNRRYTREEYLAKCRLIYAAFPLAAITTDIIVGFPEEDESDFEDTLSICDEAGFAQIHPFVFSPREGTPAAKREQLPFAVKEERKKRMIAKAEEVEEKYLEKCLYKTFSFLPETQEGGRTWGYTENYIRVCVEGEVKNKVPVRLIKREKNICIGEIIDE